MTNATSTLTFAVAEEMGEVLSRPRLDSADDFFVCGGDSLRAVELISRLAGRYAPGGDTASAALTAAMLTAVFEEPTPEGLATIIERHLRS